MIFYRIAKKDVSRNFLQFFGFKKYAPSGILVAESGYLMIVKSLTDDLAREIQRKLVISYFRIVKVEN